MLCTESGMHYVTIYDGGAECKHKSAPGQLVCWTVRGVRAQNWGKSTRNARV